MKTRKWNSAVKYTYTIKKNGREVVYEASDRKSLKELLRTHGIKK